MHAIGVAFLWQMFECRGRSALIEEGIILHMTNVDTVTAGA